MNGYAMLVLACVAFVGSHFLMSHPMRAGLVRMLKPGGFVILYSLVAFATFGWMAFEYSRSPKTEPYWPVGDIVWAIATAIMLFASVLFVGSLVRNPSFPGASEKLAVQKPFGVYQVTRHPMMWSFALWGLAHILVAPRPDNFILSGTIIFLALAGARGQEIKKAKLVGVQWDAWLRQTSFGMQLGRFLSVGLTPWLAGTLLWVLASWAHQYLGGFPAGIFRWL